MSDTLRGVITDDQVRAMRERDEARRQEAIARLGGKYLVHEDNRVMRGGNRIQQCPNCFVIHEDNNLNRR